MKILGIFPAYEPAWAFGGVVRCASNLCRAMVELGKDVSVYTTNVNGIGGLTNIPVGRPHDVGGVTVYYFPSTFGKKSAWDSRALLRTLDNTIDNFDIIYVSAIYQWMGISVGHIARQRKIPYVVGIHGSFHPATLEHGKLKKRLYWYLFLKQYIKSASALHFTTEYERQVSKRFLHNTSSFVVPNAVAAEQFAHPPSSGLSLRKKYAIDDKAVLLLTVTRPDPAKRLDILLRSFEKIIKSIPNARLLIVGPCENTYMEKTKKLATELGVNKNTIWLGYQTDKNLNACYQQSDLFLLASEHENFSMVTVEAMAAGLPVIVSEHVGVAGDIESRGAGIVTQLDATQFARSAFELIAHRDRMREMGKKARKTALELYSGEPVARLMLRAFEDVVSGERSEECVWE